MLRRLNRREYLNTIGDLLGINMLMFDPTSRFPRDQMVGHMDNIGDTLVTSGYLLEQYMDAAEQAVEKAFKLQERPKPRRGRSIAISASSLRSTTLTSPSTSRSSWCFIPRRRRSTRKAPSVRCTRSPKACPWMGSTM